MEAPDADPEEERAPAGQLRDALRRQGAEDAAGKSNGHGDADERAELARGEEQMGYLDDAQVDEGLAEGGDDARGVERRGGAGEGEEGEAGAHEDAAQDAHALAAETVDEHAGEDLRGGVAVDVGRTEAGHLRAEEPEVGLEVVEDGAGNGRPLHAGEEVEDVEEGVGGPCEDADAAEIDGRGCALW